MCTFYDNNVILKLYAELELFLKNLFYDKVDRILKTVAYDSSQFQYMYNTQRQKTSFNLHYHQKDVLDVNLQLDANNPQFMHNKSLFVKEDHVFDKQKVMGTVQNMGFNKLALSQKPQSGVDQKNSILILLLGDENS